METNIVIAIGCLWLSLAMLEYFWTIGLMKREGRKDKHITVSRLSLFLLSLVAGPFYLLYYIAKRKLPIFSL